MSNSTLKMSFSEFMKKGFPNYNQNPFLRTHFSFFTNLIKWMAIRFAYIIHRMNISANMFTIMGFGLALGGYFAFYKVLSGAVYWAIVGVSCFWLHIFFDFADGVIARAQEKQSEIGNCLDIIGLEIDKTLILVLLGQYSGSNYLVALNVFSAIILFFLRPMVFKCVPDMGIVGIVRRFLCSRFSIVNIRFFLGVFPLLLCSLILLSYPLLSVWATGISLTYFIFALIWLMVLIPHYSTSNPK